jgi:LacI family transcriptional regulator
VDKKKAARGATPSPKGRDKRASSATTLKDVATVAGVSFQTVSYVMNGKGSVSDEVRERVRKIADRMAYRPNRSAQSMRTGRSRTIGLIVSDMANPFHAEFAHAVEKAAATARYAVLLVDVQAPSARAANIAERVAELQTHPLDGVISSVHHPSVIKLDLPVVLLGASGSRDSVTADDVAGGVAVAEYVLQKGHRRVGLVTSPLLGGIPARREALLATLQGKAEVLWEYTTPISERVGPDAAELFRRRDVSVVVCSNDMAAISVQRALHDLGVKVPQEMSVVGYDDIAWAAIVTPALTTVRLPLSELAVAAIGLIEERLESPRRRSRHLKVPIQLIERESLIDVPAPAPLRKSRKTTSQTGG